MICIFKCPGCDSNMTFDIEKQMLVCRSCGTEIDAEDYDEKKIDFEGGQEYGEDIISYRCPTCSAEVEVDSSQATCTCRYCGIEMAVFAGGNGRMAPEKIIPFGLDQSEAEAAFCKWWLEHDTMPDFNRKKMKFTIRPMYLPVWLVNANTKTDMSAVVRREEIVGGTYSYSGSQNRQWGFQNDKMTFSDRDKRVKTFLSRQSLYTKFFKVPSNASYHFSSTRFFGIEPYNYMKLEDFAPGYISGLPAEHYSIEASNVIPRALNRIKGFGIDQCKTYMLGSHKGESMIVRETGCSQSIELKQIIYAMVPVWICSYMFVGKRHMVYVNGQTGKTDGEVVSSKERLKSCAFTLFLSTYFEYFAFLFLALSLKGNTSQLWRVLFSALIGSLPENVQKKPIGKRSGRKDTVELYADVDYVKNDFVKPRNIMIRRTIIGAVVLPIVEVINHSHAMSFFSSPHMPEAAFFALIISIVWTTLFMETHVKKEKEQKPAEYNDYLNMSMTDILESSEQIYGDAFPRKAEENMNHISPRPGCDSDMTFDAEKQRPGSDVCGTEKIIPFTVSKDQAEIFFKRWWMEHDTMPELQIQKMQLDIQPMYLSGSPAEQGTVEWKEACGAPVPVWVCSYTYNKKRYSVYVNGQTGKADGKVPVAEEKNAVSFILWFLSSSAQYFGMIFLINVLALRIFKTGSIWGILCMLFVLLPVIFVYIGRVKYINERASEGVEPKADIGYNKRANKDPKRVRLKKSIIGIICIIIGMLICIACGEAAVARIMRNLPAQLGVSFLTGIIWTIWFIKK